MINIPNNDVKNYSVISETYDLLNPTEYMQQVNKDFLLFRAASTVGLREMRIRSFKPIVSKSVQNTEKLNASIDITPVINGFNKETKEVSTIYKPNYLLYNEKNGLRLPVSSAQYIVEFTGNIPKLVFDINDAIAGYCEDFDLDGTFTFGNPEGTELNHLVNDQGEQVSINEYYNEYMPLNRSDNTPTKSFVVLNENLTTTNLTFNLGDYVLTFIIEININPIDIFNTSTFVQLFNATQNLVNSWAIINNECITKSANFDDNVKRADFLYNGYTLTLTSPFMKNISQKIYTDYTEANVVYKVIDVLPSTVYFPVSIMNKQNQKIGLDYLNTIYDQIIVEIDYIYEQV